MVDRAKEKRVNGYTRQQRKELTREFNKVLSRCPDKTFGLALTAAAREIRGGK